MESEVRSVIATSINRDASFHRVYFRSTSGRCTVLTIATLPILLPPSPYSATTRPDRSDEAVDRRGHSTGRYLPA